MLQQLLEGRQVQTSEGEVRLRKADNSALAQRLSLTALSRDRSVAGVLITDLTTEKENAELASRIQRLQDEERRNIARELHDSVGQLLAAITISLASARTEASKSNNSVAAMLDDSSVMVAQVRKEIRTISHLLHPPLLDVAGMWTFSERSHIKVDLDLTTDLGRLSTDAEIAIFRVVQECLTNVYRHSGSDWCSLKLERQPDMLLLEIHDSGCGMPKPSNGVRTTGVGLRGMEERLASSAAVLQSILMPMEQPSWRCCPFPKHNVKAQPDRPPELASSPCREQVFGFVPEIRRSHC